MSSPSLSSNGKSQRGDGGTDSSAPDTDSIHVKETLTIEENKQDGRPPSECNTSLAPSEHHTPSCSQVKPTSGHGLFHRAGAMVRWKPSTCHFNPENPPRFTLGLNLLFAFVSGLAIIYRRYLRRQVAHVGSNNELTSAL